MAEPSMAWGGAAARADSLRSGAAAGAAAAAAAGRYSIKGELAGAGVLLTGATGYVGGLVLESLLRCTDVGRVFVLLRPKRGAAPADRVAQLLRTPVFHLVRGDPSLVSKVIAVEGDLGLPNLGLSPAAASEISDRVDVVIHSAADIRLEVAIHDTLAANFLGTKRVLELAARLPRLRAMVHVSTAYVNINNAPGTTVYERLYPLSNGEAPADGIEIAEELLSLPRDVAERRADFYRAHFGGFPNTYSFGKHLAEELVAASHARGLPVAIVRPTLVLNIAGLPCPGHIGNFAGMAGMCAAMALGLFPAPSSFATRPYSVWDVVPGDLASSAVLAAAAALCAGADRGAAAAAAAAERGARTRALAAAAPRWGGAAAAAAGCGGCSPGGGPWLQRSGSSGGSSESGFSDDSAHDAAAAAAARAFAPLSAAADGPSPPPSPRPAAAPRAAAAGAASPVAAPRPLLVVHAATSTTYPTNMYEAVGTCTDFLRANPSPVCLLAGGTRGLRPLPPGWEPSAAWVRFWRLYNWIKVVLVCFLLRLFGMDRAAQKLAVGFQQWAMNNDPKNDTRLLFSSAALAALHERLEPAERVDFLLTFRPPRAARGDDLKGCGGDEEEPEHPAARMGWRRYGLNCTAGIMRMVTGATPPACAPLPGQPGEVVQHEYVHLR
ncbi:MAG: male sterility protein-domain-containing protein [Monoraphidium minutum]|nr:MAG: male sterility protein-domain-containing protein [Monoraphidium minutum]